MSIKTAVVDGVATIEIARPEKKNAITRAMYTQLAAAFDAAREDAAVRAVLLTGQPGIFTSGNDIEDFVQRPQRRRAAVDRLHEGADRLRQAGRRRGHRRGDRHRHDDAAALRLRLRLRRGAPGDAVREPRPRARVRVEPDRAAAAWATRAPPRSSCSAIRSPGADAVECGIANAVLPASEVVGACAPRRRALQRLAAGRRARDQAAAAPHPHGGGARGDRRRGRTSSRARLRAPKRRKRSVPSSRSASPTSRGSDGGAPSRARCRRWRSSSRSRRCSSRRRWRRGAARRCCPRPPAHASGASAPPARRRCACSIAGDSSAAGVGVARQEQAVVGHLDANAAPTRPEAAIDWTLRARTGLTTARRPRSAVGDEPFAAGDVAVVITGVNDVIDQVPTRRAVAPPRARSPTGCSARRACTTSSSRRCRRCTGFRSCRSRCAASSAPTPRATTPRWRAGPATRGRRLARRRSPSTSTPT